MGTFPNRWKTGRLVLLPKPPGQLRAYRPLCLLDTAGKLLEQLILARLRTELDGFRGISMVKGKSTVDAVRHILDFAKNSTRRLPMALFLDVRNAFNSAPWDGILARLKELGISEELRRILQSYLRDRSTVADSADGGLKIKLTCGVSQGSVLGPALWNILFDEALRVKLPRDCTSIAYADDIAIKADDVEVLTTKEEDCYGRIARWARADRSREDRRRAADEEAESRGVHSGPGGAREGAGGQSGKGAERLGRPINQRTRATWGGKLLPHPGDVRAW